MTHNLAIRLLQQGYSVQVLTNRYPRSLPGKEVLEGIPIRRLLFLHPSFGYLKHYRLDLFLASFWFYPASLLELMELVKRFHPDVVNVHFPSSQIPFVLSLRQHYHFRLVVSLHGNEILKWFTKDGIFDPANHNDSELKPLISILQQADAVTACSKYLLNKAIKLVPAVEQKGKVIYNGVDLNRFTYKENRLIHRNYCFAYGRLTYKKGFDLLINAFATIAKKFPDLNLILAGEGEQRADLETLAKELGLNDRVMFFGRASQEQVVELLLGCQCVVIPSRDEPFGIVTLEALAAGKPIVATKVGGMAELLSPYPDRAWLVNVDAGALANQIETLISSGPVIQPLTEQVLSQFSWQNVTAQYETVFSGDH